MRDFKLSYIDDVGFDIDIINGYPVYVGQVNQTQDQRAAVGATIVRGTMPGDLDLGVNWSALYEKETSLLDIDNDVKQMVQQVAGGSGQAGKGYIPLYIPSADGKVTVQVIRGGA